MLDSSLLFLACLPVSRTCACQTWLLDTITVSCRYASGGTRLKSARVPPGMYLHLHLGIFISSAVMCGVVARVARVSDFHCSKCPDIGPALYLYLCYVSASGHAESGRFSTAIRVPGRRVNHRIRRWHCPPAATVAIKCDKCSGPVENCIIAMLGIIAGDESSHRSPLEPNRKMRSKRRNWLRINGRRSTGRFQYFT